MRISGPTNPFHLARAYGVNPAQQARPVTPVTPVQSAAPTEVAARIGVDPAARLIAARVPGGINFDTQQPTAASNIAIPFYRHPADRNGAAVNIEAGRVVDLNG